MSKIYVETDNIDSLAIKSLDEASDYLKKANNVTLNVPKNFSHAKVFSLIKLDVIKQKSEIELYKIWLKTISNNLEDNEDKNIDILSKIEVMELEEKANIIKISE